MLTVSAIVYEDMEKKIFCLIMCCAMSCAMVAQTTGEEAGHTWIDLGLPSGVKWGQRIFPVGMMGKALAHIRHIE